MEGNVNVVGIPSDEKIAILGEDTEDLSLIQAKVQTPNEEYLDVSVDLFTVQL
jgi:hypothetical protein